MYLLRGLMKAGGLKGALDPCVDTCIEVLLGFLLRIENSKVVLELANILVAHSFLEFFVG